jgi:rhodanese-related sulfurtransferase
MKKLLSLAALAAGAFAQDDVKKISVDELKELISDKIIFLDVRSPEEIAEFGTLKSYVNIPMDQLEKRMSEIPKDKRIITA